LNRALGFIVLAGFCGLMIYASFGLPLRGDPQAPINRSESPAHSQGASSFYISNAMRDAATPNMVTVILADYRGYDTLGEETVILTAGLCCFLILRRQRRERDGEPHDAE
jgi:multicomponent Na+:H+ antiporter subunit B